MFRWQHDAIVEVTKVINSAFCKTELISAKTDWPENEPEKFELLIHDFRWVSKT